ncbi:MAG: cupin domain-containing protein [Chloroflexota bacterium]|nr:cupin domain-containing protein [Chloroflexota bacterium]
MRRFAILVSLLVFVLIGAVMVGQVGSNTFAQEATPSTDDFAPEGLTFAPIAFTTTDQLPAAPVDFYLARVTFDPGAGFPVEASDASVTLVSIESGSLTFQFDAPISVTRAATMAAFATPGLDESAIPAPEEMAAGTEFTMTAGDSAYFPANIAGEVRNDGQEPAVVLIASIEPLDAAEAATPAA